MNIAIRKKDSCSCNTKGDVRYGSFECTNPRIITHIFGKSYLKMDNASSLVSFLIPNGILTVRNSCVLHLYMCSCEFGRQLDYWDVFEFFIE